MFDRHRYRATCAAIVAAFSFLAAETGSAEPSGEARAKARGGAEGTQRPSGLLVNAASAAAAAADAADAAAKAASAASDAAAAALDALKSIQPSLKATMRSRVSPTLTKPTNDDLSNKATANGGVRPLPETGNAGEEYATVGDDLTGGKQSKFFVPAERSLVGLVGVFELPVHIDLKNAYLFEGDETPAVTGELNLVQAVAAGMGFSRDALAAEARLAQASAQSGQARALLLPSLTTKVNGGKEKSDPTVGTGDRANSWHRRNDSNITLKQPLFSLPDLLDWRRRETIVQSREATHLGARGDAYVSTVSAYLTLVSSRVLADIAGESEQQLNYLLEYVEKRAAAGASNASDAGRVRARSLAARSTKLEQEAAYATAGVEFVRLTNLVPNILRLPEMSDVGLSAIPPALNEAITTAIAHNPDVTALQLELDAADIDRTAAKGRFLPRFDLEMSDQTANHAEGSPGAQKDARVMLVMNWSLFNGGGDVKFHAERIARRDEIRYRLDDQKRKTTQALSAQYATLSAARSRLAAGYRELAALASAANAMSQRMLSGNQSLLDLLDVQERYYQARSRLVSLHIQEMGAVAQIARLVDGGGKTGVEQPESAQGRPGQAGPGNAARNAAGKWSDGEPSAATAGPVSWSTLMAGEAGKDKMPMTAEANELDRPPANPSPLPRHPAPDGDLAAPPASPRNPTARLENAEVPPLSERPLTMSSTLRTDNVPPPAVSENATYPRAGLAVREVSDNGH